MMIPLKMYPQSSGKQFQGGEVNSFHIKSHVLDHHGERSEVKILKTQEQIRSDMIETLDGSFICKVCDFSTYSKVEIHKHVNQSF